jgi:SpoVK/Ycf46/Vps4 family AAA+-type ATPase
MREGTSALFELEITLPDAQLSSQATRLIGFDARFQRVHQDLRLLLDKEGLEKWSDKFYRSRLPLLDSLQDRYPLVVFYGDVGTGKTATAEAIANGIAKEMGKQAMLFKLSTRVRGSGNVGEMSSLINQAFEVVTKEAGKAKLSFLIIDEADSLAASRTNNQSHHEDKVAVNTLIQKIDEVRRFNGRVLVIFCTNHFAAIDPAILRRAAYVEEFHRPDDEDRAALFKMDCDGLGFNSTEIVDLVQLTGPKGPHKLTFTFSDIRTRIVPEALGLAYPDRKITVDDLMTVIKKIKPSPEVSVPKDGK